MINALLSLLRYLRKERFAKFLFLPTGLNFINICRAVYYEYAKTSRSDEIIISKVLKEVEEVGLLQPRPVEYYSYRLGSMEMHDVYLWTSDGGRFCRGTSTDYAEACAKAVGEVFERTALRYAISTQISLHTQKELRDMGIKFVASNDFAQPTQVQFSAFPQFRISEHDVFSWISSKNLLDGKNYLIPAQTIFYNNFINFPNEKMILQQSTHGAGAGYTYGAAVISAICEIIHRHFFLDHWYRGIAPPQIDLATIPKELPLMNTIRELQKAGFNLYLLDYSGEANLPTTLCVLEKHESWSIGASSNYTMEGALERAIGEAVATYLWHVETTHKGGNRVTQKNIDSVRHDFTDSRHGDAYWRVMLYNTTSFIKNLNIPFLEGFSIPYSEKYNVGQTFNIESYAKRVFGDVYIYEANKNYLDTYNYHVVRAVIPKSYPFALTETCSRPVLNGKLPTHTVLNPFP